MPADPPCSDPAASLGAAALQERLTQWIAKQTPDQGICRLFSVSEIEAGEGRSRGMFPRLIPFGFDGENSLFALVLTGDTFEAAPVARWKEEGQTVCLFASDMSSFLGLVHRIGQLVEPQDGQGDLAGFQNYWQDLLCFDPGCEEARLQLAAFQLSAGRPEEALNLLRERNPGDWRYAPDRYFLLGEALWETAERPPEPPREAVEAWARSLCGLTAFSGQTGDYPLEMEDLEIQEIAWERCRANRNLQPESGAIGLAQSLIEERRPFAFETRLRLAGKLEADGEPQAETEMLNALALSLDDEEEDEAYDQLTAYYERRGDAWSAAACRADREKK